MSKLAYICINSEYYKTGINRWLSRHFEIETIKIKKINIFAQKIEERSLIKLIFVHSAVKHLKKHVSRAIYRNYLPLLKLYSRSNYLHTASRLHFIVGGQLYSYIISSGIIPVSFKQ